MARAKSIPRAALQSDICVFCIRLHRKCSGKGDTCVCVCMCVRTRIPFSVSVAPTHPHIHTLTHTLFHLPVCCPSHLDASFMNAIIDTLIFVATSG